MTILKIDRSDRAARSVREDSVLFQMTLAETVKLSGKGLHSGKKSVVEIHPAPENTGIVFRHGLTTMSALASNVVDTSRGTTIGFNGLKVMTVEHLMAALRGAGVDNAFIEISGGETPALDGSSGPYIEAIESVGLVEQEAERRTISLQEPVCVRRNDSFILAVPADEMRITYVMSYDHPMIGTQSCTYVLSETDFGSQIAPARTFVLYEEVAALLDRALARGGSVDNVIVIWQDRMSSALRFPDELVRHKVLDIVGDLALVGGYLNAEILAVKSGHALNVEFAKEVLTTLGDARRAPRVRAIPV